MCKVAITSIAVGWALVLAGGCQPVQPDLSAEVVASARAAAERAESRCAELEMTMDQLKQDLAAAIAERDEARGWLEMTKQELSDANQSLTETQSKLHSVEATLAIFEERLAQVPELVRELQASLAKLRALPLTGDHEGSGPDNGLMPKIEGATTQSDKENDE